MKKLIFLLAFILPVLASAQDLRINQISSHDSTGAAKPAGTMIQADGSGSFEFGSACTDDQTISTDSTAGNISIENGNTININVNDADADSTNELQDFDIVSLDGTTLTFSLTKDSSVHSIDLSMFQQSVVGTSIVYGALYNMYALNDERGFANGDFRVPTNSDFDILCTYIGGFNYGYKLKDASTTYWGDSNNGTDEYGFTARPNGIRGGIGDGTFTYLGTRCYFHSSDIDQIGGTDRSGVLLDAGNDYFIKTFSNDSLMGKAVRLVRDATTEEQALADGTECDPYTGNNNYTYTTVKIGTQVWLASSLAETKFADGTTIPYEGANSGYYTDTEWAALSSSAMCYYNNDDSYAGGEVLVDGTDDQQLTISNDTIFLEDGGYVELPEGTVNTDDQTLSLDGNSLSIEDGNSVDLSSLQDGTGTDDQQLSLASNTLTLEDGGSVDLSGYLDNTDDQTLSLDGNSLSIEDGNSVDLSTATAVAANTAKTSFPGFTDLLTDYSFTDNSTNWDEAYSWGDHSGLYVPLARTITINGTAYDLSADRSWTITATPGGSSGSIQYNNSGALGGFGYWSGTEFQLSTSGAITWNIINTLASGTAIQGAATGSGNATGGIFFGTSSSSGVGVRANGTYADFAAMTSGIFWIKERSSTPSTLASGYGLMYLKDDGNLYLLDDSFTEKQLTGGSSGITEEENDLSTAVTWTNVPDAYISESSVTQHEAALSITESQISDFGTYLTSEVDGSVTNEIQTIDVSQLSGTTLQLSLSSDGEATKEIDLSGLQDGTGTDDQTISLSTNTITLEDGGSVDISTATAVAANTAKTTNATHTGEVTGSDALTIASNVVDYDNLASDLTGAVTDNDGTFDYSAGSIFTCADPTNTALAFSNIQFNKSITIDLTLTSATTISFNTTPLSQVGDAISAAGFYIIHILAHGTTEGSLEITVKQVN